MKRNFLFSKTIQLYTETELPKQKEQVGGGDVKLLETKGKRNNWPLNEKR